ncbi:hypothetical protein HZS_4181 [Henneguya salminicola]|nr:hypothetical protein HZS_4181 [Henneguya salminicola]
MNEIINLAIIFDFSCFNNKEKISKNLLYEFSKLLLFLQTWNKKHTNEKRKLYISYQVSSFHQQKFYRQQHFAEFDKKIWDEIKYSIQKYSNMDAQKDQPLDINNPELYEKHFFSQLQKFSSDFYWENNDLSSPLFSNNTRNENCHATKCSCKKNIAIYVTPHYYPLIIESRNTLKVIVNNFNRQSLAFIWFSENPSDDSILNKAINSLLLFNSYVIPFGSYNLLMDYMYKFITNMRATKIISKNEVLETKHKYNNILQNTNTHTIGMKIITNSGEQYSVNIKTCNKNSSEICLYEKIPQNIPPYHNINNNIHVINICDFAKYSNNEESLNKNKKYYYNINDKCLYCIQKLINMGVFIIFPAQLSSSFLLDKIIENKQKFDLFFLVFNPWVFYSSFYSDCQHTFDSINATKIPIIEGMKNYFKNCSCGNHPTYCDSMNPEELISLFGFDQSLKVTENDDFTIISNEIKRFYRDYNDLSPFFELEKEKLQYICKNYVINVDLLINKTQNCLTSTNIEICKKQILIRVFLLNKFWNFLSNSNFIQQIIILLQKLSVWKMPHWVGHFLKHDDLIHVKDKQIIGEFRKIYDQLCHPYPKSLYSPSCKKEMCVFKEETENIPKVNQFNMQSSSHTRFSSSSSFSEINNKRREILIKHKKNRVMSFGNNNRMNTLNKVKRSLFGSISSVSVRRVQSDIKSKGSIIFSISPQNSAYSFDNSGGEFQMFSKSDNINDNNVSKFYIPNSQSNISLYFNDKTKLSSNEESNMSHTPESLNKTKCLNELTPYNSPKTASIINRENITPDKKYSKTDDLSLWNTTPFKYYKCNTNYLVDTNNSQKFSPLSVHFAETVNINTYKSPSPKKKKKLIYFE